LVLVVPWGLVELVLVHSNILQRMAEQVRIRIRDHV
jgi:hypothetical protein